MSEFDFSVPHLLRDEAEYDRAVARVHELLDAGRPGDDEEVAFLSLLIEDFDARHFAVAPDAGTPREIVDLLLEQHALTRAHLARPFGGRSRVSDFFAGKRELSKGQMRWLHEHLGAPLELLPALRPGR